LPEVFTIPGRNPHFTGRASELDTIHTGLGVGAAMTVQAVHGLGEVGKTQLVIEYAHRYATAYDLVWWINAEQPSLITSQLAALTGPLGAAASSKASGRSPSNSARTSTWSSVSPGVRWRQQGDGLRGGAARPGRAPDRGSQNHHGGW